MGERVDVTEGEEEKSQARQRRGDRYLRGNGAKERQGMDSFLQIGELI